MKKILVTGGLGFIGSHTVVELQNSGYQVIIIDNLYNSSIQVLENITSITGIKPEYYNIDLREKTIVQEFFQNNQVDGIIHFAASKAVGESVENPLLYYENNIITLVYLLQEMKKHQLSNFIFSSSCTVYGQADELPITESAPVKPASLANKCKPFEFGIASSQRCRGEILHQNVSRIRFFHLLLCKLCTY